MEVRTDFPYAVEVIDNQWITLADGTQLAAKIWLPQGQVEETFPAILEYIPYRKRDGTAIRDALTHPWFAGHGYACIRVDMRGNGESQGLMHDEYLLQEQDDGIAVIDWLTQQPWCDGNVGMMGISWGGFNGLQIAARRPPALKAIITLCSTDDRYADDIHYKGGNMLLENVGWAATMLNFSAAVPDPLLVTDWREQWLKRLDEMPLLLETWLSHQSRDTYWQHGSVREDYAAIEAAVYAVGGWGDAYSNAITRLMDGLTCPKKALIGPWVHKYPHFAVPDPAIGFLQEALRWWDYWLKGKANGMMDEPPCHYYLQDSVAPQPSYHQRPGKWLAMQSWTTDPNMQRQTYYLGDGQLTENASNNAQNAVIASPLTTGTGSGEYCIIWLGADFPTDQRRDNANSLCFETTVLEQAVPLLGAPKIRLRLSSDKTCGQICVRLNDLAPDGSATRITYGCLNLKMRDSFAHPTALVPDEVYHVELLLDDVGYTVPAGHRLQVAISSAYFPLIWSTEQLATLTLHADKPQDNALTLPIFDGEPVDNPFEPPESATPQALAYLSEPSNQRQVIEDIASGEVCTFIEDDFGQMQFLDHGLTVHQTAREHYRIRPNDPHSAEADITWTYQSGRDDWQVNVTSRLKLTCDETWFYLEAWQTADEKGETVHQRHWQRQVKREFV